jgi:hypothetical protein
VWSFTHASTSKRSGRHPATLRSTRWGVIYEGDKEKIGTVPEGSRSIKYPNVNHELSLVICSENLNAFSAGALVSQKKESYITHGKEEKYAFMQEWQEAQYDTTP